MTQYTEAEGDFSLCRSIQRDFTFLNKEGIGEQKSIGTPFLLNLLKKAPISCMWFLRGRHVEIRAIHRLPAFTGELPNSALNQIEVDAGWRVWFHQAAGVRTLW